MRKSQDHDLENEVLSRRSFLKVSAGGAAVLGAGSLSGCMHAAGMRSKASARYQDFPNANGERCGGCTHFQRPNRCEIVEGDISPEGWCRFHRAA